VSGLRTKAGFAIAWLCAAGCGGKGTVTFSIEAPSTGALSPFADPRRNTVALTDEITGAALGQEVSTSQGGAVSIGDLAVGRYDVRLSVAGGAQLLGLARSPGVTVAGGQSQTVVLHARKPIAYFGSASLLQPDPGKRFVYLPGPDPLMVLDTTLPPAATLPSVKLGGADQSVATAATHDGLYLLVGTTGHLAAIATADHSLAATAALAPAGGRTPRVTAIVLAPDDTSVLVLADAGVALVPLAPLLSGATPTISLLPPSGARAAAFSADGSSVTLLTGPDRLALDCAQQLPSAATWVLPTAPGSAVSRPTPAPNGATDFALDASGAPLFAQPCGRGVVSASGTVALAGDGLYRVLSDGTRLIAIAGDFARKLVPVDPDDPSLRNVMLPFGQILVDGGGGAATSATTFSLPPDRITLNTASTDGSLVQARLAPSSLLVYDAALSPDGTHLVFASRLRSEANALRYLEVDDQNMQPIVYCVLDAVEDVYRISEVDLDSGAVGYASPKGVDDKSCQTQCYQCLFGGCMPQTPGDCGISDGYVPSGVSVLMGFR
jgi:hypothetical protein